MIIKMKDKVAAHEFGHGGLRGVVTFGTGRHLVEYTNPFGQKAYRSVFDKVLYEDENIVPIGGYQFAFDKLFNIGLDQESTLRVGDLNDEAPQMKIGVQRANYDSIYYNAETSVTKNSGVVVNTGVNISALNYIFGFMIGDGGAREDNVTAIAPDYKRRNLYRAVPFRMSNDGTKLAAGRYYGKSQTVQGNAGMDPITSYYVKKFDDPAPRIVHVWVTDNPNEISIVDDSVFASTSSMAIESYVEINLSVDKDDARGFFTSTESSPRINEFALVSGWYNARLDDYEALRMFTHFTRPSINLSDGDGVEAIYRLYAR
ncbi:MAG: hypothetical protein NC548_12885 [Lachnospiraceae bacterium]|nr:hypothetical protein [Lachnospiraceae bacterium]MCM1230714.1 hypothetical protein [Ruminococcus flavefaciens]